MGNSSLPQHSELSIKIHGLIVEEGGKDGGAE